MLDALYCSTVLLGTVLYEDVARRLTRHPDLMFLRPRGY